MDLAKRAALTRRCFERVHEEVFAGDPAENPQLTVEVVEPAEVAGVHTLVLITPWTVNGMFFPGDEMDVPHSIEIGTRLLPVFVNELEGLGRYGSVNLLGDVSCATIDSIQTSLESLVPRFRAAIRSAFSPADVPNPDRRALLFGRSDRLG